MTVKGVKLKSESFFPIPHGVLELWRKNLREGQIPPPPGLDRVKSFSQRMQLSNIIKTKDVWETDIKTN